jgi:hypothetical protein
MMLLKGFLIVPSRFDAAVKKPFFCGLEYKRMPVLKERMENVKKA